MKKLLTKLFVVLLICALTFATVGCHLFENDPPVETPPVENPPVENPPVDDNKGPDKTALNAELALEVTAQGDYTLDSYNAYAEKLAAAKAVAADEAATQEAVDQATAALSAARLALAVRPVEEVAGANKALRFVSGDTKEIALADYVNVNGLSKITYQVKTSNAVVELGSIADGKFTITAGDVREETDLTVSIIVSYDGAEKLTVELSVKITNDVAPTLNSKEVVKEYDLIDLENKENLVLDFAANVINSGNLALSYSVKCGEEALTLEGTSYTLTLGTYTEEAVEKVYTVTVSYTANGVEGSLEYTLKLSLKDTSAYGVVGGDFENGVADGWTVTTDEGSDKTFGGISDRSDFWDGYPMHNKGKYFTTEGGGNGSLASPYFTVKSDYATYMIGGAKTDKVNIYITIENEAGEVLALYRNTKFADLPAGEYSVDDYRAMIGDIVFACNFATYKVDLSAFAGQKIRFVIHDHVEGDGDFSFIYFDELITYYASADAVPENATPAENLLANKTALNEAIASAVAEQGDYTEASYEAYLAKLNEAKALVNDVAVTQATVDAAVAALADAQDALAIRPVVEVENATKSFRLTSGNSKEITLADYVNINGLSKITYAINADNEIAALTEVADGKFTITAGTVNEATTVKVSIIVSYNGEEKLTVELSVLITNDVAPKLYEDEIIASYDIYELENKENLVIDLAKNVDNGGNLALSYTLAGSTIEGSSYTYTFGSYTYEFTEVTLPVIVSYEANGVAGTLEYTIKLSLKDTTAYRLVNGGFENGMDGWTVVGNVGNVSSDTHYWVGDGECADGFLFDMDGTKMFSAYATNDEAAFGTLTSSTFTVGGSGFVTFKLGAMKNGNQVYVDVVNAETGDIIARYYNGLWADRTNDVKSGCTLVAYKANLSEFAGTKIFFRVSDYGTNDYGLFFADSFVTYYEEEPTEGFNNATPVEYEFAGNIYDVFNGGFEKGDLSGWQNDGEPGAVTDADYFFSGVAYGKDGNFLYSGVEDAHYEGETLVKNGNGKEGNRGILTSSVFEIGGSGYITYMLGGGGNEFCFVQVIDAVTGEVLGRYHQQAMDDAVLKTYVADLSAYKGRIARIQVVDQASSGWGCVSFDNVVTYHTSKPAGIDAIDIRCQIVNGGFETGNLYGWESIGEIGVVTNASGYWGGNIPYEKVGEYLFTGVESNGADTMRENNQGTLTSSAFIIGGTGYISFKLGGGGNENCYIQIIDATTNEVLAKYRQQAQQDAKLIQYVADLSAYIGSTVKLQVVDYASSGWGCVSFDNVVTYYESTEHLPEGAITANDIK